MTGAQIAARAAGHVVIPQASGKDRAFAAFFRALMYGAVGISMLALATLLYDVARDGAAAHLVGLPDQLPLAHHPGELGHPVGDLRDALADGRSAR